MRWPSYDDACAAAYAAARRWLAPGNRNSQYLYAETLTRVLHAGGRWLDVGCGHGFLPSWLPAASRELPLAAVAPVGIDLDESAIRRHGGLRWKVRGDIERLPFHDGAFAVVTANMVVEHVKRPVSLFAEFSRVLAPGGVLVIHTPNVIGYTTALTRLIPARARAAFARILLYRKVEDVYPTYYRLNSEAALSAAAAESGIAVSGMRLVESSPQLVRIPPLMMLELALMRALRRPAWARYRPCILAEFRKAS